MTISFLCSPFIVNPFADNPYGDGTPSVTAYHGVRDLFSLSSEYCANTFLDLNNVWPFIRMKNRHPPRTRFPVNYYWIRRWLKPFVAYYPVPPIHPKMWSMSESRCTVRSNFHFVPFLMLMRNVLDNLSSLDALITALADLDTVCETIEEEYLASLRKGKFETWEEKSWRAGFLFHSQSIPWCVIGRLYLPPRLIIPRT